MSKLTEITNFENDLTNLLKNIKFRAAKGYFQQQLMQDLRNKEHQNNFKIYE